MINNLFKKAGSIDTRPEDIFEEFGLTGSSYKLSSKQAQAILDLRLQRLTGLAVSYTHLTLPTKA